MNWRSTWLLFGLAAALFAFIYLVERHQRPTSLEGEPPKRLLVLKPAEVTNVQLRITNQLVLRAERGSNAWMLVAPLTYPAQFFAIEQLLQEVTELVAPVSISREEMGSSGRTVADYGLDVPQATLTLQHQGRRSEVMFGSRTPAGDQLYVQSLNDPTVYLVDAAVLSRIPRNANQWRDTAMLNIGAFPWDRMEVRMGARGYTINRDPTNTFFLLKPIPARADVPKVDAMLRKLATAQVQQFVSDDARAELDAFGLQTPELELAFGLGTNDTAVVQFGKSPTNDAALVYVRRLSHTNIVLVQRSVLESLQVPATELRDRHLVTASIEGMDTLEVTGPEGFAARKQQNGAWVVIEPQATTIDPDLMRDMVVVMQHLEGTVEKDVVTDFAAFGLATPARQYFLKSTTTNAAGAVTNRVLAQLDCSAPQNGRVFVRRGEEKLTVYSLPEADYSLLPSAAWQLRDRRVWSFNTNHVTRLTFSQRGRTNTLVRGSAGKWTFANGTEGIINPNAVEELMFRLGELRAEGWLARGETNRVPYGFVGNEVVLNLELKGPDKPHLVRLELGNLVADQLPCAAALVDGQTWIFKFPLKLYVEIFRDLVTPLSRG